MVILVITTPIVQILFRGGPWCIHVILLVINWVLLIHLIILQELTCNKPIIWVLFRFRINVRVRRFIKGFARLVHIRICQSFLHRHFLVLVSISEWARSRYRLTLVQSLIRCFGQRHIVLSLLSRHVSQSLVDTFFRIWAHPLPTHLLLKSFFQNFVLGF